MHKWMLFWAQALQVGPEEGEKSARVGCGMFPKSESKPRVSVCDRQSGNSEVLPAVTALIRRFVRLSSRFLVESSSSPSREPCLLLLLSFTCHCVIVSAFTKLTAFPASACVCLTTVAPRWIQR